MWSGFVAAKHINAQQGRASVAPPSPATRRGFLGLISVRPSDDHIIDTANAVVVDAVQVSEVFANFRAILRRRVVGRLAVGRAQRVAKGEAEARVETMVERKRETEKTAALARNLQIEIIDDRFAVVILDSVEGVEFVELIGGRHRSFSSTALELKNRRDRFANRVESRSRRAVKIFAAWLRCSQQNQVYTKFGISQYTKFGIF